MADKEFRERISKKITDLLEQVKEIEKELNDPKPESKSIDFTCPPDFNIVNVKNDLIKHNYNSLKHDKPLRLLFSFTRPALPDGYFTMDIPFDEKYFDFIIKTIDPLNIAKRLVRNKDTLNLDIYLFNDENRKHKLIDIDNISVYLSGYNGNLSFYKGLIGMLRAE